MVFLLSSFGNAQGLFTSTEDFPIPAAALELSALPPNLEKLKEFMDFVSNQAKPPTDNSIFWGLVGLIIQVGLGSLKLLPKIFFSHGHLL